MYKSEFNLIASMIANKTGVRCEAKNSPLWRANTKDFVIEYPDKFYYTEGDLGLLIHESAHLRFSKLFNKEEFLKLNKDWYDGEKKIEQIFNLVNSLEDTRVETKIQEIYRGADYYIAQAREEQREQFPYISADYYKERLWDVYCHYVAWRAYSVEWAEEYLSAIGFSKNKKLRKVISATEEYLDAFKDMDSTKEVVENMSKDILKHYLTLCDDKDVSDEFLKKLLEMFRRLFKQMEKSIDESKEKAESGILIPEGRGILPPEIDPKKFFKKQKGYHLTEEKLREEVKKNLASTRKAISILKDLDTVRHEGNYESGKLQNRKLFKLRAGVTKIFTRKVADVKDDKNMVFIILVDESGSMCGNRAVNAAIATAILAETLRRANKSFAVFGFNDKLYLHKNFNKKLKLETMLEVEKNAFMGGSSWNSDGWAINQVTEKLSKRPEKNKILVVISDGEPAPTPEHRSFDLAKEAKEAEKVAKVYAIGIQTDAVKAYYSRSIVIQDPSELGPELIKIFKENVGKRVR